MPQDKKFAGDRFRETWQRSLVKTVAYRVVILILDFAAVYLLTGKSEIALGFMVASNVYTLIAYYLHERTWDRIKWGKIRTDEKKVIFKRGTDVLKSRA